MKSKSRFLFPVLLVLTCTAVYAWQHFFAGLTYLPNNVILPVAVLTPVLLILTFLTTLSLMKLTETERPVMRSFAAAAAMLVPVLVAGIHMLNYAARRFAGILPVKVLPEFPGGIILLTATMLGVIHLTVLLAIRLKKSDAGVECVALSSVGWILMNVCLLLITF